METFTATSPLRTSEHYANPHSHGVSWSAVMGGAFVTAALGLILLALGTGLGLSSISIWDHSNTTTKTIGAAAIIWLIVMEIVSSAMGGYLAGRLRTKWTGIHSDEVYFRDTAHGFLAWCVALVVTAAFMATAATSLMGSGANKDTDASQAPDTYFVDSLLRGDASKPEAVSPATYSEVATIMATALRQGVLPAGDRNYLSQVVASRTGLSTTAASQRVDQTYNDAIQAADTARKALAHSLLWLFLALLVGAFSASVAATIGGRQRDHVVTL
jgi:hypothetical protein